MRIDGKQFVLNWQSIRLRLGMYNCTRSMYDSFGANFLHYRTLKINVGSVFICFLDFSAIRFFFWIHESGGRHALTVPHA